MARTPLIAGNWKMNLNHLEAIGVVQKLAFALPEDYYDKVDVALTVPFTDIRSVQTLVDGDKLRITYGAQDVSRHESGAYTGEVSAEMLAKLGCSWAVVGHSERREYHGESDELVAAKAAAALKHGISPIVCVGEPLEVREAGEHVDYVVAQTRASLAGLDAGQLANTVVAYERSGRALDRVLSVFYNLLGPDSTPERQEIDRIVSPLLAEHHSAVTLDAGLFARIDAVHSALGTGGAGTEGIDDETERLVRRHEELRPRGDERATRLIAQEVADNAFGAFLVNSELDERGDQQNAIPITIGRSNLIFLGRHFRLPFPNLTKWFDEVNLFLSTPIDGFRKRISIQVRLQFVARYKS